MVPIQETIVNVVGRGVMLGTVLLFAAIGECFAQRSGFMNLTMEGIMTLGASLAYQTVFLTGNMGLSIFVAMAGCMLISFIAVYLNQRLYLDQVVTGMALYIFAFGLGVFIHRLVAGGVTGLKFIEVLKPVGIPLLSSIPVIGPILFNQNILVYVGIAASVAAYFIMYRTHWGLTVRAVGENPKAADNAGINVYMTRYITAMLSGAGAGVAGAYLIVAVLVNFQELIVSGRGWITIAMVIFAQWNPIYALIGSYFFGSMESVAKYVEVTRREIAITGGIPYQFFWMVPYIASILALVVAFKKAALPSALFKIYKREEAISEV